MPFRNITLAQDGVHFQLQYRQYVDLYLIKCDIDQYMWNSITHTAIYAHKSFKMFNKYKSNAFKII